MLFLYYPFILYNRDYATPLDFPAHDPLDIYYIIYGFTAHLCSK